MSFPPEDKEFREQLHRIDRLIKDIDTFKDPQAKTRTREIVQAIMDFHGKAIERLLERIAETGDPGLQMIDAAAQDDLVSSLLLLYGLHPLDLESRVRLAIEKVQPTLQTHGGSVSLLDISDGIVRLRLEGSCHGCPSSAKTLQQTIEEAIFEIAPDVAAIEVADEMISIPDTPSPFPQPGHFALPILAAK